MCVYTIRKYHNFPFASFIFEFSRQYLQNTYAYLICVYTPSTNITTHTLASFIYESSRQYLQTNTCIFYVYVEYDNSYPRLIHIQVLPPIFTKHTWCIFYVYIDHNNSFPRLIHIFSHQYLQNTHVCIHVYTHHTHMCIHITHTCVYTSHAHVMRQTLHYSNMSPPANIHKTHRCIFMCKYITHTSKASNFATFIYESSRQYLQKTHE